LAGDVTETDIACPGLTIVPLGGEVIWSGTGPVTVKIWLLLLAVPPTITTTGPVVAPAGTAAKISKLSQPRMVAGVPLKVAGVSLKDRAELKDFMMFDRERALVADYTSSGQLLGATATHEQEDLLNLCSLRDRLMKAGIPWNEFCRDYRVGKYV
jgi:hypothetical protein